jgi:hypothetical protein
MTELEAEAFAARLTRVWEPQWAQNTLDPEWRIYEPECRYYALIQENVFMQADEETMGMFFSLNFHTSDDYLGRLTAYPDGEVEVGENMDCVTAQWLPFFRRGCWLSGCDIEATAHEKAQWIQGFTREEVESWNLV